MIRGRLHLLLRISTNSQSKLQRRTTSGRLEQNSKKALAATQTRRQGYSAT